MSIVMYLKPTCPFCKKAQLVLKRKGVDVSEIDIAKEPDRRAEMIAKANGKTTVPQIFINEQHIGGCDELLALDAAGKLDEML